MTWRRKINSCRTVRPNRKDVPRDYGPKQLKLKRGDIRVRTRGGLTAFIWKNRPEVYMLTNMDPPTAEGNICDSSCPMKPHILERYNRNMDYINNSDCMANSYSMSWHIFKWITKLFFYIRDPTILNSWILLSSCGAIYTHWDFRLLLARNLNEESGTSQDHPTPRLVGRPSAAATNVVRLESCHNQHGQQNHPPNSAAICVHLASRERVQCISAPDVTWAYVWCLVTQYIMQ